MSTATSVCSNVLNPGNSMRTVYVPTGTVGTVNSPLPPLTLFRSNPEAGCVTEMAALGTTAPDGSFTTPRISPVVCASSTEAAKAPTSAIAGNFVHPRVVRSSCLRNVVIKNAAFVQNKFGESAGTARLGEIPRRHGTVSGNADTRNGPPPSQKSERLKEIIRAGANARQVNSRITL